MSLFAEIRDGRVAQVIVCDSVEWLEQHLGGTWVETNDSRETGEQYAGIGMGHDPESHARFALDFRQPNGPDDAYEIGACAFKDGRVWQNLHDGNEHPPGEFGWVARGEQLRRWREGETYARGTRCLHDRQRWRSRVNGNKDEPSAGSLKWALVAREEPPPRLIRAK